MHVLLWNFVTIEPHNTGYNDGTPTADTHPLTHTPHAVFSHIFRDENDELWSKNEKPKVRQTNVETLRVDIWTVFLGLKLSSRKVTTHNVYLGGFLKRCPWGVQLRTLKRKSFKEEKAASVGFFLDYKTRTRISPKVLNVSGWKLFCQHRVPTTSLI